MKIIVSFKHSVLMLVSLLAFWNCAYAADDYLEPEKAFAFSAQLIDSTHIQVNYQIADGYYMYRQRFQFNVENAQLGTPLLPPGIVKFDQTFQKQVETYRNKVSIVIPVQTTGKFTLKVIAQGCADLGLCYAPMESMAVLDPNTGTATPGFSMPANRSQSKDTKAASTFSPATLATNAKQPDLFPAQPETGKIESSLKSGKLSLILPLFFLLGLGLAFTPCVLPMVPILASIIVGAGEQTNKRRSFGLAAVYSLGMAIVYTALGISAGLIGEGLSASLQNPWVLTLFALLMLGLSLSMFGVYQLQMPSFIQGRLAQLSDRQSGGKWLGALVMGALSALIVGPCVAAPLAGALVYISQTRDVVIGGSALFALATGMSVPLLLVGLSAGSLLPRAGIWMESVKQFFGVLMLAVALWMIAPVVPVAAQMLGWAALGLGYGAFLFWGKQSDWFGKAAGVLFTLFGALQIIGIALGSQSVLTPLAQFNSQHAAAQVEFVRVKSIAELDAALANSSAQPVMLDFYADWCASCKEMEKFTFSDTRVQAKFKELRLLQVDVTANNQDDKALLKRFNLFGPPGILFFDRSGHEIAGKRVIGYQNAEKFLQSLQSATQ